MNVSIEDVAKRANVSISTVSRVLNGRNVVQATTRKRVEDAIEVLGYRPNVFARGLSLRKSHILGVVLPDLHGEFYSEVIRGANAEARQCGYSMLLSSVPAEDDGHGFMSAVGNQCIVDGLVVMVSEMNSRIRSVLADVKVPLVVLDAIVDGLQHDSVVIDQRGGATALMQHFVNLHPERPVVFIGGRKTNLDTIDRLAAYQSVLSAAGRQPVTRDVYYLDYMYDSAYRLAQENVLRWSKDRACVFTANDEMAAGVIEAASAHGLQIPRDIPLVGFDDTRIARLIRPRLTTVHVPMAEMGAAAIRMLSDRITEPAGPPRHVKLPAELIIRESCGGAPPSP
jgi:LacI family transcriptional regulator